MHEIIVTNTTFSVYMGYMYDVGGELCVIGGRWIVNTSGGLESKGVYV